LQGCDGEDVNVHDLVSLGSAFVNQRGCGKCHQGPDGTLSGQTTPRPSTRAYPKNLTPDHETGIGDWADIQIIRAIRFGVDERGQSLCVPMPLFEDMTSLEADAIVAYLRSLQPVKREIPESLFPSLDGGTLD
jgi:hypothetical protein